MQRVVQGASAWQNGRREEDAAAHLVHQLTEVELASITDTEEPSRAAVTTLNLILRCGC